MLLSAESDERVVQSSVDESVSPLLGNSVHSHSTLTLLAVHEVDNSRISVPGDLITGTLDIEEVGIIIIMCVHALSEIAL